MKKILLLTMMPLFLGGCITVVEQSWVCSHYDGVLEHRRDARTLYGEAVLAYKAPTEEELAAKKAKAAAGCSNKPPVEEVVVGGGEEVVGTLGGSVTTTVVAGAVAAGVIATALDGGKNSGTTGSVAP